MSPKPSPEEGIELSERVLSTVYLAETIKRTGDLWQ